MKPNVVELEHLGADAQPIAGTFPPGQIDFSGDELAQRTELEWSATIERKAGGVRFAGRMHTEIELACVRCLEPIVRDVERAMDLFFELGEAGLFDDGDEIELDEGDIDTAFIVGTELHVDELMHEQVLLDVPMKPLCGPDCRGLCPTCGVNLNRGECGCRTPAAHPAFEKLAEFRKQMEDRGKTASD